MKLKYSLLLGLLIGLSHFLAAQKNKPHDFSQETYVIANLDPDTVPEKERASSTLRALKSGAVVVRLKTSERSVDAYRRAGKTDIADRIVAERKKQNQKMYYAYKTYFTFCPVYFIYAKDTKQLMDGNRKIFLNEDLNYDDTISFNYTNYIFSEYGSAEAFSDFSDVAAPSTGGVTSGPYGNKTDTIATETNTMPASTSSLIFLDKHLKQLKRPFPYLEAVYLESFNASVKNLNRELAKAYYRLVMAKDFRDEMKRAKQKGKN